jgi:hypothetical protein
MRTYQQLIRFLRDARYENSNPNFGGIEAYYPFVCPAGSTVTMSEDYAKYTFDEDRVFESGTDLGKYIRRQLSRPTSQKPQWRTWI